MNKRRLPHYKFCWHCSQELIGDRFVFKFINGTIRKIHIRCKELIDADAKEEDFFGYKLEDEGV